MPRLPQSSVGASCTSLEAGPSSECFIGLSTSVCRNDINRLEVAGGHRQYHHVLGVHKRPTGYVRVSSIYKSGPNNRYGLGSYFFSALRAAQRFLAASDIFLRAAADNFEPFRRPRFLPEPFGRPRFFPVPAGRPALRPGPPDVNDAIALRTFSSCFARACSERLRLATTV